MKELGFFYKDRHRSYTHLCLYVVWKKGLWRRSSSICWPVIFYIANAESLSKELSSKKSELVLLSRNLVDAIWEDRPARPASLVFHLDEKYSGILHFPSHPALVLNTKSYQGQSHADKVVQVREELEKKKAKAVVVTMLDEVAWLFNLRGSDIDFNPGELWKSPLK